MNWKLIGKNIFLNDVYESEEKQRKIFKNGNEYIEPCFNISEIYKNQTLNLSLEFLRISNIEHYKMLLKSMLDKDFLESYQRSLTLIYKTYFLINNYYISLKDFSLKLLPINSQNPLKIDEYIKNSDEYKKFIEHYKKMMFLTFIKGWKQDTNEDLSHIKWESWMYLKNNSNYLLGIQYGISLFLKERKEEIFEFGLINDLDSAILNYPISNKYIFTQQQSHFDFAPFSYLKKNISEDFKQLINKNTGFKNKKTFEEIVSMENIDEIEITSPRNNSNKIKKNKEQDPLLKFFNSKTIKLFWNNFDSSNSLNNDNYSIIVEMLTRSIFNKEKVIIVNKSLGDGFQKTLFTKDFIKKCEEKGIFIRRQIIVKNLEKYEQNNLKDEIVGVVWYFSFHKSTNLKEVVSFTAFSNDKSFWKIKSNQVNELVEGDRVFYQTLSKSSKPTGMISSKIANEVYYALQELKKEHKDIDHWIAKLLKVEPNSLSQRLSGEQIDAIALGVSSLLKNKGLIIADETGFGKGRILAALSIIGLNMGKSVLFFTENKQLFSDFYRDILAVKEEDKIIPLILNQSGKIFNPNGELIVNQKTPKKFKEMIDNKKQWDKNEAKFIITNYAQINKKGLKQPKIEFLKNLLGKNTWVILDEAHNASGDSNINENLKYLIDSTEGVIFSSATYAKTEEKLSIYDKAMPLSDVAKDLLKLALFGDQGDLRELLTKEMAKQGNYIRREHPPIDLPEIIFIKNDLISQRVEQFCNMWKKIFSLAELREEMLGYFSAKAWLSLGATLNRSIREFSFLNKAQGIVSEIEQEIKNNKKIVLVTEITFEAMMKDLVEKGGFNLENDELDQDGENNIKENSEEKNYKKTKEVSFQEKPNWCWKWLSLIEKMADEELLEKELFYRRYDPEFNESKYQTLKIQFNELYKDVEKEILKNDYFGLSPLDELKENLRLKGITLTELSGRTYQCIKSGNEWIINNKLEKKERTQIVSDFNSGVNDVILITRSGASGISLHAGEKFKDKRVRKLLELDIASNTANRIQFLGRVRRKDQVVEPEFGTPLLKIPYEIRKMEVEKRKQIKLSAHVGGRKQNKVLDWISEEGEMIIEEWGKENKGWAKKIGAFNVDLVNEVKRIDRALTRSLILPKQDQQILFKRIEKGIECHTDFHFYQNVPLPNSKQIFSKPFWGNHKTKTETRVDNSILNLGYITLNYRLWDMSTKNDMGAISQKIKEVISYIRNNPMDEKLSILFKNWKEVIELTNNKFSQTAFNLTFNLIKNFKQGQLFTLGFKNNLYQKTGVLVDVNLPKIDQNFEKMNFSEQQVEMISSYSLNTISLKVLFEDDVETVNIPLYLILKGKDSVEKNNYDYNHFKLLNKTIQTQNFYRRDKYLNTLTIEGNPILFSIWNKKMKIGKIETIYDLEEGSKTILLLPKQYKINDFNGMSIPFINTEQIKDYLYQHIEDQQKKKNNIKINEYVVNSFNDPTIKMRIVLNEYTKKYDLEILFEKAEVYKKYSSKWILKANQFIKNRENLENDKILLTLHVYKLYQIISLMQEDGVFFFCPNEEKGWFEKNIYKYINNQI